MHTPSRLNAIFWRLLFIWIPYIFIATFSGCGGGGGSGDGGNPNSGTDGARQFASGWSEPSLSDDGRYIAYTEILTAAPNSMPANVIQYRNVFLLDKTTGQKTLISIDPSGTSAANGNSYGPVISGDGRYVLFASNATNMANGISSYPIDASSQVIFQLYVRDVQSGTTRLITIDPAGTGAANEWTNTDKYVISRNGRYVAFSSKATNLVSGISYFGGDNVFVRDLTSNTTELISIATDGVSSGKNGSASSTGVLNDSHFPAISDDGRYVAFTSFAWNLVSGVSYTEDIFGIVSNVFLRDRSTQTTMLISVSPDGTQASDGNCSVQLNNNGRYMSADGSLIVFSSRATNLAALSPLGGSRTSIYIRDTSITSPVLVSHAFDGAVEDGSSYGPTISADGNYVVFFGDSTNLIGPGINYNTIPSTGNLATNVFRWTRATDTTEIVSLSPDGNSGANFDVKYPALSNDGRIVVFSGSATNLVSSPEVPLTFDAKQDSVYRWDAVTTKITLATQANNTSLGYASPEFAMSHQGNVVVFDSSDKSYFISY